MTLCQNMEPLEPNQQLVSTLEACDATKPQENTTTADCDNSGSQSAVDQNNNETNYSVSKRPRRACRDREYNLRDSSKINRIETERRRAAPKQPKPKAKPPPLSKYRRRTANARERSRMKEINDAFDELRKAIPQSEELNEPENRDSGDCDMKLTKITTLRLAMNYITVLREILGYDNSVFNTNSSASSDSSASSSSVSSSDSSSSSDPTNSPNPSIPCSSPGSSAEELTLTLSTCDFLDNTGSTVSPPASAPPYPNTGTVPHPYNHTFPQLTLPRNYFSVHLQQSTS